MVGSTFVFVILICLLCLLRSYLVAALYGWVFLYVFMLLMCSFEIVCFTLPLSGSIVLYCLADLIHRLL